ncbi:precorrin-6A reductase CobK [Phaeobacter piscinae]|uniref:Precorrin-6A reductase CobK n=1 Tax=Phaeobacter piscinae TaxID=1580596 RepID=A0ABM6PB90_9RHOB|nr:cobalt-precorrin-6A reductase [Phaeobacter piscinae]ATG34894.1 precorrin-6A reductase CobK [Phaeobacter piscinae]AUQ85414.1 precorrin-6A reductase CobK [Phaeobacter piscinae]AUR23298.1 precorrin-6A reductase CobK [Phaeobacter piscinae]
MTRILLLGGTTEASALAKTLAEAGADAVFSYAGRTAKPVRQPLPTRVGGFGGVGGLAAYLLAEAITHVIDATHPFAAQMSTNAVQACKSVGVPICAFERPAWQAGEGDQWVHADSIEGAVDALPEAPARVFLAIGKQNLAQFAAKPQHHYLLRLVDKPEAPLPLPHATVEIARGPFDAAGDTALMQRHGITHVVAKNAGGAGAAAKLTAARGLGLPVIMIARPEVPARPVRASLAEVMDWIAHPAG